MAIKFRSNPAPLTGALLVSNPRRKKRRRKASSKRRNTAAGRNRTNRKRRKTSASKRRSSALKRSRSRRRNGLVRTNRKNGLMAKKRRNRKNRRNMMHKNRRNALAIKNRRNRRNRTNRKNRRNISRKNRRNGTKRGMRRKTARRAYSRRRNTVSSYLDAMPKSMKPLHKALGSVPLVGKYGVPSLLGMAGAAPVALFAKHLKEMDYMAGKPVMQDLSFAIAGLLGAGLLSLGKSSKAKENLGFMLAVAGGSISAYKLLERYNPFGMFVSRNAMLDESDASAGLFMSPDYTYPTVPIDHPYNGVHMGDGGSMGSRKFLS